MRWVGRCASGSSGARDPRLQPFRPRRGARQRGVCGSHALHGGSAKPIGSAGRGRSCGAVRRNDPVSQVFRRLHPGHSCSCRIGDQWWTAATLESLAEKSRIDLDRPISAYLADVPPDKAALTIRQTLSHTSGLPKAGSAPYKTYATLEEAARFLLHLPLIAPPGTTFQYNGSAMQVAGHIAEKICGKPWDQLFREALGAPLELQRTTYGATSNPILGGGISTSLDDLGRFLLMLAAGGVCRSRVVLKPETVRDMEQNIAGKARSFRSVTDGPLAFVGYNAGNWCEAEEPTGRCTLISSYGGGGTYPWLDRRRGIYGVFLVNDNLVRDEPYFKAVREIVERIVGDTRDHLAPSSR